MTIEVRFKNDWAAGHDQNDFTVTPGNTRNFQDPKEKKGFIVHCNTEDDGGWAELWSPFLLSESTEFLQGAVGTFGTKWIKNKGSINVVVDGIVVAGIRHIPK